MCASMTRTVFSQDQEDRLRIIPVKHIWWFSAGTGLLALILYVLTMYPTVTWWDDGAYSLAASTLGVAAPPGSLLLTILGWLVTRLPLGVNKVVELHMLAGVLAAVTSIIVAFTASRLLNVGVERSRVNAPAGGNNLSAPLGLALGAMLFAASPLMWDYATRYTPYVLTALFTGLILLAIISWWKQAGSPDSGIWLFLVMLLFGLDVSVHRTNSLMLPAFLVAVLILKPRTYLSIKAWLNLIVGLALGLAFHLLLIPIAEAKPYLNIGDPSNLDRFWDYVSLAQYGGGFLVNLFPRKAAFWGYQVKDYLDIFCANFLTVHGPLNMLGLLPGLFGIAGFIIGWRRNPKLSAVLTLLFVFMSLGMVIYLNQPPSFVRSLDRHYLPSLVIFALWIAYGCAYILYWLGCDHTFGQRALVLAVAALIGLGVVNQIWRNYHLEDGSKQFFAYDTARNYLTALPPDAILLTSGDNDTWIPWYLQQVEGFRTDVTVCNLNLFNTPWYLREIMDKHENFPVALTDEMIDSLTARPWHDSTFVFPVPDNAALLGLPTVVDIPDSMVVTVPPTFGGKYLIVSDQILLAMIRENKWRRPIYLTSSSVPWLGPFLRAEGIVQRLMPSPGLPGDADVIRENLYRNYVIRGYNDSSQVLVPATRWAASAYVYAFVILAHAQQQKGEDAACRETMANLRSTFLLAKLDLPPQLQRAIEQSCVVDSSTTSQ